MGRRVVKARHVAHHATLIQDALRRELEMQDRTGACSAVVK
jgi:hypothetical protein